MQLKHTAEPKWRHRSFFDEVDAMIPPHVHPNVSELNGRPSGSVMYAETAPLQRTVQTLAYDLKTGEAFAGEFTMPHQQYVRGLDPNGHVHPLIVKTCQIASEDRTGYDVAKVAEKVRQGWLIIERHPEHYNLTFTNLTGLTGEPYAEHCRKEYVERRERYTAKEARDEEAFKSKAVKAIEEQQVRQEQMIERQMQVTNVIAEKLVGSMAPPEDARVAKLEAELADLKKVLQAQARK